MPPLKLFVEFLQKKYDADHNEITGQSNSIIYTTFGRYIGMFQLYYLPLNQEILLLERSDLLRGRHFVSVSA